MMCILQTCMGRCEELKNCVMCFAYQSGPLSRHQCNAQCSDITMNIVDVINPDGKPARGLNGMANRGPNHYMGVRPSFHNGDTTYFL